MTVSSSQRQVSTQTDRWAERQVQSTESKRHSDDEKPTETSKNKQVFVYALSPWQQKQKQNVCFLPQVRVPSLHQAAANHRAASGGRLQRPPGWGRWLLQPATPWPEPWRTAGTGSDSTTAPTAWGPAAGPSGCPRSEPPAPGRRAAAHPLHPDSHAGRCDSAGHSYGPGSGRPESECHPAAADPGRSTGPDAPDRQSRSWKIRTGHRLEPGKKRSESGVWGPGSERSQVRTRCCSVLLY